MYTLLFKLISLTRAEISRQIFGTLTREKYTRFEKIIRSLNTIIFQFQEFIRLFSHSDTLCKVTQQYVQMRMCLYA